MKCPKCNFENNDDSNFCINCGNKLKINSHDKTTPLKKINQLNIEPYESVTIDNQYDEIETINTNSSENLDKIFTKNNFTLGQINKIKSFMESNNDENQIKKLIQDEISNNKHHNNLSDEEYKLLLDFSKKIMMNDLNENGIAFIQYNGSKTITETVMQTVKEEVPVVKQKHGGLTKGAATLGFGLVGLAGTSGTKTEMQTVEKQVPIQVQKTVKDKRKIILKIKDNRLEINYKNLKSMFKFSEINEITQENKFIYIKTIDETITLKQQDNYFIKLLKLSLSENIYYLKNYKAIQNKYLLKFSNDLNNVWISEILTENKEDHNLSEINKIELIKKYHSLKESGIITEEEFEKKKQELLN